MPACSRYIWEGTVCCHFPEKRQVRNLLFWLRRMTVLFQAYMGMYVKITVLKDKALSLSLYLYNKYNICMYMHRFIHMLCVCVCADLHTHTHTQLNFWCIGLPFLSLLCCLADFGGIWSQLPFSDPSHFSVVAFVLSEILFYKVRCKNMCAQSILITIMPFNKTPDMWNSVHCEIWKLWIRTI